ncbi:MAG: hypothetical protein KDA49_01035 [Rhodospirillaceae bacterium]|nr:hypothetical protein [Rhodospirillaceae bacterium]
MLSAIVVACGEPPDDAQIEQALVAAIRSDAAIHGLRGPDGEPIASWRISVRDLDIHEIVETDDYWRARVTFNLLIDTAANPQRAMVSLRQGEDGAWQVFRVDAL